MSRRASPHSLIALLSSVVLLCDVAPGRAQTQVIAANIFSQAFLASKVIAFDLTRGVPTWQVAERFAGSPTGLVVTTGDARYVVWSVERWLAPGGPTVARLTTPAPSIAVDPAPPGTYYVRIRGVSARP